MGGLLRNWLRITSWRVVFRGAEGDTDFRPAPQHATASMVSTDRPTVFVHLLPSLIPPGSLPGAMVVVVDVLRTTTVMVHALAAGCQAVIPCGEIDEAKSVASRLPAGTALLAGERLGLPIPGFALGNSPADFTAEACAGKTLVMTTTNGTRAILSSLEARRVYIASFANLTATVDAMVVKFQRRDRRRFILCVPGRRDSSVWRIRCSRGAGSATALAGRRHRARGPSSGQRRGIDRGVRVVGRGAIPAGAPAFEVALSGSRRAECATDRKGRRYRRCRRVRSLQPGGRSVPGP